MAERGRRIAVTGGAAAIGVRVGDELARPEGVRRGVAAWEL